MAFVDRLFARLSGLRSNASSAYFAAVLLVAAATALRLALDPWLFGTQFLTFFPAVLIATFLGGFGPGCLSAVLSVLAVWFFILTPQFSFAIDRPGEIGGLAVFAVVAGIMVLVVTGLRMAAERIRSLNGTLTAVFDANPDAILLLDRTHRIVRANARASALFGYAPESLIGAAIERLLPERLHDRHRGLRAACTALEKAREMAADGDPVARASDGREFPVNVRLGPIHSERELLVVAIVRDLTAERAAAEALTESERQRATLEERERASVQLRRWSDAFENAAFGIAVSDPKTDTVLLANPALAAMRGMTRAEIEGKPVTDNYVEAELARVRELLAEADRTGHATFESWHRHKTGPDFPVEMNISSVRDADGNLAYRIVSVLDITERRRAEEELRQMQRIDAIGRVSGGIAHDFNNLLGVIIGNLELCGYARADHLNTKELIAEALTAARGGADLTARLLAFSRRQSLRTVPVQPNLLIDGLMKMLTRVLGEDIEISLDLAATPWPVLTDPVQLEQGLVNLATNARDAMPNGGKLTIATANCHVDANAAAVNPELGPGDYVMIAMTDSGVGMPPDVATRVFEPFFTTKEFGKGNGLGLSTLFGFAKQSGGHVTVESAPGRGTIFRLYLPRSTTATEKAAPAEPAVEARTAGEVALLVEDNPSLRRVAKRVLAELGYAVIEADGPPAALAILAERRVGLLFSDIVMPGPIDGVELARQTLERWPGTAVLLTSGYSERLQQERARSLAKQVRLLKKPYSVTELAAAVDDALRASTGQTP
jgi:PAS domain S-box-containing protein